MENAIPRYNFFSSISKTLRILEFCLALLLLSWTLTRLPLALTVSAQCLRGLAASPLFVFAVSNVIIAALVAQSGRFSGHHDADHGGLYREFMNSRAAVAVADDEPPPPRVAPAEERCEDKEVVSETVVRDRDGGAGSDLAKYRRSQSEKWKGEAAGRMVRRKQLRRSETEKRRDQNARENLYPQDKLSNEEFQRAIEAFIAKQMRFLREESSAIVVQNNTA